MLFKYGGQPLDICQPATHDSTYAVMFCVRTVLVTATANDIVALVLQQGPFSFVTEAPCLYAFHEPGCALWRLAQSVSAKVGTFQLQPVANNCHLVLCQLPLILIEGCLEGGCLSICPSSACALYPVEQSAIWCTTTPLEYCVLFIYQADATRAKSEHDYIDAFTHNEYMHEHGLPSYTTALNEAKQLNIDACIDLCHQTAVENG